MNHQRRVSVIALSQALFHPEGVVRSPRVQEELSSFDYLLAIVTLFFAIFFTLFLFTASYSMHDPRWPARDTSFREFLESRVGIGGGTMRGRDVLIEIALIPVALAFAATLIGLAWVIFG